MKKIYLGFALLILLSPWNPAFGQACSCGGAPILSALELPATQKGTLQLSLTYEYSSIADVFTGSLELKDDSRERVVHSILSEINYGLTDRISISALLTFLQQERTSQSQTGAGEFLRTRGIGDGILLIKYNLIPFSPGNQRQMTIGGGIKFPLGKSSLHSSNTLLAADMQPGTGSWDGVLWGYLSQGFYRIAPFSMYSSVSYRQTGTNDRFGENLAGYSFGNEFMLTYGINTDWSALMSSTVALRYRTTSAAKFAGGAVPNSGGNWLNFEPSLSFNITNSLAVRANGQIPIYRDLDGTQLTTSYKLLFSVFYTLAKSIPKLKI